MRPGSCARLSQRRTGRCGRIRRPSAGDLSTTRRTIRAPSAATLRSWTLIELFAELRALVVPPLCVACRTPLEARRRGAVRGLPAGTAVAARHAVPPLRAARPVPAVPGAPRGLRARLGAARARRVPRGRVVAALKFDARLAVADAMAAQLAAGVPDRLLDGADARARTGRAAAAACAGLRPHRGRSRGGSRAARASRSSHACLRRGATATASSARRAPPGSPPGAWPSRRPARAPPQRAARRRRAHHRSDARRLRASAAGGRSAQRRCDHLHAGAAALTSAARPRPVPSRRALRHPPSDLRALRRARDAGRVRGGRGAERVGRRVRVGPRLVPGQPGDRGSMDRLAAIAQATSSVTLGPLVTPLARRRPWKLARETATLDRLSSGRLVLGVGLGVPRDYELFGEPVDARARGDATDEAIDCCARSGPSGPSSTRARTSPCAPMATSGPRSGPAHTRGARSRCGPPRAWAAPSARSAAPPASTASRRSRRAPIRRQW